MTKNRDNESSAVTNSDTDTGDRPESPTLEHVAARAGVSTATVSRAINQPDKVVASTRTRIQNAIEELGYTPHFGARFLASSRSNTVGAIIPTMANAMFAGGLQAFQEELAKSGYTLLVASSGYDAESEFQQIESLTANGADGLLLIGASRPSRSIEFLQRRKIPFVLSWCSSQQLIDKGEQPPLQMPLVAGFDNTKASYQLTREIIKKGHRKIAMIAGDCSNNDRARARVAGVKQAIDEHPSTVDPDGTKKNDDSAELLQVIETEYSLENGGQAFAALMASARKPTVIVCGNDVLAAGAIVRARTLGIAVPEDVSITGFDDIALASAVTPALTTVSVPQEAMGRAAARLLLQSIETVNTPANVELTTNIVYRDSLRSIN